MQKTKAIALALALAITAMLGLGGCSTTFDKERLLQEFESGDSTLYIINRAVRKELRKEDCDISPKVLEQLGKDYIEYFKNNQCQNLSKFQVVSGFYYTHPIKGMRRAPAFAPIEMDIGIDDILKLSVSLNQDGSYRRPVLVEKLVKKDGAKEPADCNWEGGRSATTAFLSGGVVCEGWDWKKQKFAQ